ncbi:hypothetical protein PVAND_017056 [Polypedilum vanderplanki]|uniref:Odorant binding protein n=1 Tax=Polypedilum vanderplanki TaxID=319348 RepID=A0A9J6BGZ8_POLVA|nr:hypothetical protein PVAND_017056 [Polypedilum vanderplanki]
MKFISAFLVVLFSVAFTNALKDPAAMMKIAKDCKESTGASDADVGKIMSHSEVDTKEGKCMFNCLMEAMGVVKGGQFIKESAIKCTKEFGAPDDVAVKIIDECSKISDADPCELSTKLAYCFKAEGKKYGHDIGI